MPTVAVELSSRDVLQQRCFVGLRYVIGEGVGWVLDAGTQQAPLLNGLLSTEMDNVTLALANSTVGVLHLCTLRG